MSCRRKVSIFIFVSSLILCTMHAFMHAWTPCMHIFISILQSSRFIFLFKVQNISVQARCGRCQTGGRAQAGELSLLDRRCASKNCSTCIYYYFIKNAFVRMLLFSREPLFVNRIPRNVLRMFFEASVNMYVIYTNSQHISSSRIFYMQFYLLTRRSQVLSFDISGDLLATATGNNAVHIWSVHTHACVRIFNVKGVKVAFSPDGSFLAVTVVSSGAGHLGIFSLTTGLVLFVQYYLRNPLSLSLSLSLSVCVCVCE